MKDTEALTIARVFVNEFVCRFGVPDSIHTDQGKNFEAKIIKEICTLLDIKKTHTTLSRMALWRGSEPHLVC